MIKLLITGIWGCAVMSGGAYVVMGLRMDGAGQEQAGESSSDAEFVKTDMTSVPVIRDGKIEGYVVFQLAVALNPEKKLGTAAEPLPYIVDEAFQVMYGQPPMDFDNIKKLELAEITKTIAANINLRLGTEVVRDVLIESLNYVPKDNVRTHWIAKE